jgi:hypothetical protein
MYSLIGIDYKKKAGGVPALKPLRNEDLNLF